MAAKGTLAMFVAIGVILVTMVGMMYWLINSTKSVTSEVLQPRTTQETIQQISEATGQGKAATFKVFAVDEEAENSNKLATTAYCWVKGKEGTLLDGGSVSLSSTTATSVGGVVVGDTIECIAYNETATEEGYYGLLKSLSIVDENEQLELPVRRHTESLLMEIWDNGDALTLQNNITVGASATQSLDKIKVELNTTNVALHLGAFAMDVPVGTNITDITMASTASVNRNGEPAVDLGSTVTITESSATPTRLREQSNFYFRVTSNKEDYFVLEEYDFIETGAISISSDGDGCGGIDGNADTIVIIALDWAPYQSVQTATKDQILFGVENNEATPVDIGADDFSVTVTCTD